MNSSGSDPCDGKTHANAVLAQVLRDRGCGSGQVIRAKTVSRGGVPRSASESAPLVGLPKARLDVVEAYRRMAQRSRRLEDVFGNLSELGLELQGAKALRAIFGAVFGSRNDGWEVFRKRFPLSQGVMEVSCPAFSHDFSQAMIEVGQQEDWLAGSGVCCLYHREDGQWKLLESNMTWIS